MINSEKSIENVLRRVIVAAYEAEEQLRMIRKYDRISAALIIMALAIDIIFYPDIKAIAVS